MTRTLALVALLGLALILGGGFLAFTNGGTAYEYEVKSEQVQSDSATINESEVVQLSELDGAQREAIFHAWKKSDHFLGGASAHITTDEPLNLSQDERFQVVEIEGVRVLVGIHGPETYTQMTAISLLGSVLMAFGIVAVVFAFAFARGRY